MSNLRAKLAPAAARFLALCLVRSCVGKQSKKLLVNVTWEGLSRAPGISVCFLLAPQLLLQRPDRTSWIQNWACTIQFA